MAYIPSVKPAMDTVVETAAGKEEGVAVIKRRHKSWLLALPT
jgi:hypothetical protein